MKKQVKTLTMSVCAAALISALQPANAAIIQVFGVGGLTQGPYTLHDFEAGASGPGAAYSSVTGIESALALTHAGGVTPSGVRGLSTIGAPDPITISFGAAASSVGLFFGNDDTCCSAGFPAFMDIFDISGLIGTIGVVANMNDFADQFLGFTSDEAVTSVRVRYGSGSDVGLYHYIDDVQFNAAGPGGPATVPEPVTLGLLGAGLAGLGLARRRKA